MVDSSKFADFTEKAKQHIDQIKIGLLRHDKNPKDREFLNDIAKSVQAIKVAAVPVGLPRILELCQNLENLVNLIKEEKKELHQEIIITLAACRDRFSKFVFELETLQMERSKVRDLVRRIQGHIDDYNQGERPEAEPALTEIERFEAQESIADTSEELSLLPEEIVNKDYDKELFQIYIEQLQENISLLRTLTDSYPDAPNKDSILTQCSNLVGKLQSSSNYMAYDKLAGFFLQWVAELEMESVDLSLGTPVSFDFMDQKIKKIVGLFPELEDIPADPDKLNRSQSTPSPPPPVQEDKIDEEIAETQEFQEMFSSIDEGDEDDFDAGTEPIAALSGVDSSEDEHPVTLRKDREPSREKKESRSKKIIEIDGSFLEEEKESGNYDEELFQIFVQQLQENISQLQLLTNSLASEPNKSSIVDKCSNLVGKLQSSANYMGYERLAEYYLQWIAELEMTGVELSLGSDVTFDFMQEKIDRVSSLFLDGSGSPSIQSEEQKSGKTPSPEPIAEKLSPITQQAVVDEEAPVYDDLIDEDEEEEPLAEGIEPIAGISDEELAKLEESESSLAENTEEPETGEFSEAVNEKLESFFADIEEPESDEDLETSFMAIASLSEMDDDEPGEETEEIATVSGEVDTLFEGEAGIPPSEEFSPIAGISEHEAAESEEMVTALFEEEPVPQTVEPGGSEFSDALNDKLETFFTDTEETEQDLDTSMMEIASISKATEENHVLDAENEPVTDGEFEELFDETQEEAIEPVAQQSIEPIAGISDEFETELDEAAPAALEETLPAEAGEPDKDDFGKAVDEKMQSLFADIEPPEEDAELETSFMEVVSSTDEETDTEAEAITTEPSPPESVEALFEDEEIEEEPPGEVIAAIAETSEEMPEPEEPASALFDDETAAEIQDDLDEEFSDSVDDTLETFFTDIEEPEAEQDIDASMMEIESIGGGADEEQVPTVDEVPAAAIELEDLFEDEEKEEPHAEVVEGISDIPGEIACESEITTEDMTEEDGTGEAEVSPVAEGIIEELDTFFDEGEVTEDTGTFFGEEMRPEDESAEEVVPVSGEPEEEIDADEFHPEDLLTDEELLHEIAGPTVGEEIVADSEALRTEIETAEETASALEENKLDEEELFRRLHEAVSTDQDERVDTEELVADDEAYDESGSGDTLPETAPERNELFQRLSNAIHSLDDETEDLEEIEEAEAKEPEPEFDNQLFDRLVRALETSSNQADIIGSRPIDHVLEEILSSTPIETGHLEKVSDDVPKKLAASEIKQIIHMDTDKVDHLMNQVGELNANRSILLNLFAEMNDLHKHYQEMDGFNRQELKPFKDLIFRLGDTSVSLNRLSSEIREGVLKVRMVPISLLFDRYPEFIDKLTSHTNKQVELEIVGEDTELEKIVIDDISEPLTHLISNTVEHGIEDIDERRRLGKEDAGKIKLEAYHDDSELVIEVTDDGRGIDLKKVKAKALEQGLFTGDELYQMSDKDLKRLILNPNFSTIAEESTKPEDRGEGLNIVRTNIEALNGSIDIRSKANKGTIIQIRVPLSHLVVKALKVQSGAETMALPVSCIKEIIKVHKDMIIEEDGSKAIKVHETTLPVFKLTEVFNIETVETPEDRVYIIIVEDNQQSVGLIVDDTDGLEEIVIKPLGEYLRRESGFSGATIISNGNISLVPDVGELIRIATERQADPQESVA